MPLTTWNCARSEAAPVTLQCADVVAISPADDSVDSNIIIITGSGTITSFGDCSYYIEKRISFKPSGNITLVNSASLNLLGRKNRTFNDWSYGTYQCDSQNNWHEIYFTPVGTV
jgi:hypothetical protein